jgi:hypothetical protein
VFGSGIIEQVQAEPVHRCSSDKGLNHSMVIVTPPTLADNSTPTLTPRN